MSDPKAPAELDDIGELVGRVELTAVMVFEVAGERVDNEMDDDADPQVEITVQSRGGQDWIEPRLKMVVDTPAAQLRSDVGARFQFDAELVLTGRLQAEFIEKIAVMTIFPYLRESVTTSALRLGVPAPVVGLLKQGELSISAPDPGEAGSRFGRPAPAR